MLRLAFRDLQRRAAETVLLFTALTVAATTLTIGLLLHGQTAGPYAETRRLTNGPDVVAVLFPSKAVVTPADQARLATIAHRPSVVAQSPILPTTWTQIAAGGVRAVAEVQGRDTNTSDVDRPRVVSGHWVARGGVVVERAFARALNVDVGDTIELGNQRAQVVGIAVSAALPPYPQVCTVGCALAEPGWKPSQVGLVWATTEQTAALATRREPLAYFQYLRLDAPAAAPTFVNQFSDQQSESGPYLESWQELASRQDELLANERTVVVFGSTLLIVLALATLVVLVGGRMADEVRRVGTLKAVGATPGFVARMLLVSYLAVGLVAGLVGVAVGRLVAPRLIAPSAGVLGRLGATSLSSTDAVVVVATNLGVVALASALPAWRAARVSTMQALGDAGRTPRRSRLLVSVSAYLPTPALLGLRLVARRPRRFVLTALSIGIAVCGSVTALYAGAGLRADGNGSGTLADPHAAELHTVLLAVVVLLSIMAVVNIAFVTRASVADSRRMLAIARTLGATPRAAAIALGIAQIFPTLVGLGLGTASGSLLFHAIAHDVTSAPTLVNFGYLIVLTLAVVVALTALPARIEARQPIAKALSRN